MGNVFRIDSQRFDARPMRRDARGFVTTKSYATRCGIFEYTRSDGSKVKELRHPDDVFDPAHLESLNAASITVGHPRENVSPRNVRSLEVGVVTSARRDGHFVAADLSIRDAAVIAKVERGELSELSCGYSLKIDPTPGTYLGEAYSQRQMQLRVNHLALLPPGGGRAGRDVRIRADSASSELFAWAFTFYPDLIRREKRMDQQQQDDVQRRLDAAEKKLREAGLPRPAELTESPSTRGDAQPATGSSVSIADRLAAAERRFSGMGGGR